jgi:hypothetical protein
MLDVHVGAAHRCSKHNSADSATLTGLPHAENGLSGFLLPYFFLDEKVTKNQGLYFLLRLQIHLRNLNCTNLRNYFSPYSGQVPWLRVQH